MSARWEAKASATKWAALVAAVPLDRDAMQDASDAFPAASAGVMWGPEKGSRHVLLQVHDGSHEVGTPRPSDAIVTAHWRYDLWVATREAGTEALAKNERVGGPTGLFERLAEHWPTTMRTLNFGISAVYRFSRARYAVHGDLCTAPPPAKLGGKSLTPDAVVWTIQDGDEVGYVTLTCAKSEHTPNSIAWSGTLSCKVSATMLDDIDRRVWENLAPLFTRPKK